MAGLGHPAGGNALHVAAPATPGANEDEVAYRMAPA